MTGQNSIITYGKDHYCRWVPDRHSKFGARDWPRPSISESRVFVFNARKGLTCNVAVAKSWVSSSMWESLWVVFVTWQWEKAAIKNWYQACIVSNLWKTLFKSTLYWPISGWMRQPRLDYSKISSLLLQVNVSVPHYSLRPFFKLSGLQRLRVSRLQFFVQQ